MLGKIRIVHAGGYDPRQGRTMDPTLEPSPSPAMTPSPSPPTPTSPDGEGASCGPAERRREYAERVVWLPACSDPPIDRAACK
jgi:hypothetical protein